MRERVYNYSFILLHVNKNTFNGHLAEKTWFSFAERGKGYITPTIVEHKCNSFEDIIKKCEELSENGKNAVSFHTSWTWHNDDPGYITTTNTQYYYITD